MYPQHNNKKERHVKKKEKKRNLAFNFLVHNNAKAC
jgi:hypothetical protein